MIAFSDASKSFGDHAVLEHMTLDLAETGITCLLGVSGCGKSTALRVAAGLTGVDSGEVFIPAGACGVVFQDTRLLPWLTTAENLSLAIPAGQRRPGKAGMLEQALNAVALDPGKVAGLFPRELSGGMAQRAGIARALLRHPRFLMMDEPFAALDAMTRNDLQQMLRDLVMERQIACLFVTHDIEESFSIAERILVMKDRKTAVSFQRDDYIGWEKREIVLDKILTCLGRKRSK